MTYSAGVPRLGDGIKLEDDVVWILRQHHELAAHRLVTGRGDFDGVLTFIKRQSRLAVVLTPLRRPQRF